jgi:hypothetical protein
MVSQRLLNEFYGGGMTVLCARAIFIYSNAEGADRLYLRDVVFQVPIVQNRTPYV